MVKALTLEDHAFIDKALKQVAQKTSAKISIAVVPASALYLEYVLIYGFMLGSVAAMLLWEIGVLQAFPWLLCVQLGIVALCDLVPVLRQSFVRFVPLRARHHFAALAAMRNYHTLHAHIGKDEPFVLLFVSLAERYVHVVTSPVVHRHIPGDWHKVTDLFTQSMRQKGLRASCAESVATIADILAASFRT